MDREVIICRGFCMCVGNLNSGDIVTQENKNDGDVNQFIYAHAGSGTATSETGDTIEIATQVITDLSSFAGKSITYTGGPSGGDWIAFNPTPSSKKYQYELLDGPANTVITNDDDKECIIVCVDDQYTANGIISVGSKKLKQFQYTRILQKTSEQIVVPANSVAILMRNTVDTLPLPPHYIKACTVSEVVNTWNEMITANANNYLYIANNLVTINT
jgi:hypothetical protein